MTRILKLQRLDVPAQIAVAGNSCTSSAGGCCNGKSE